MWEPLINICEKHIENEIQPNDLNSFKGLSIAFSSELKKISYDNLTIPYGRYLLSDRGSFNIQMDVFSNNYSGSIHSHGTWGMFGIISGSLQTDDWLNINNNFTFLRSSILFSGCINAFTKSNDWHRVSTLDHEEQTVSIHIYGNGYDLEKGFKLNDDFNVEEYTRSDFLDFENIKKNFVYNS